MVSKRFQAQVSGLSWRVVDTEHTTEWKGQTYPLVVHWCKDEAEARALADACNEQESESLTEQREGTLVASSNRGRYALDEAETGPDLTSSQVCDIWLDGRWVKGRIEHAGSLYAIGEGGAPGRLFSGYYFLAGGGGICGLCTGMRVRVPV